MAETEKKPAAKKAPAKKKPAAKKVEKKPEKKTDPVELLPPVEVSVSSSTITIGSIIVSREFGEIAEKMLRIQKKMKSVFKDGTNPHFDSHFASLDNVFSVCKQAANDEGLLLVQGAGANADGTVVETTSAVFLPEKEQFMATSPRLGTGKVGPHAGMGAITYGRRGGLGPLFGLTFSDDDDGNTAQDAAEEAEKAEREGRAAGSNDRVAAMQAYHAAFDVVMKAVEGTDDPLVNAAMEEALIVSITKGEFTCIHTFGIDKLGSMTKVLTEKRDQWIEWFSSGAWHGDRPEPMVVADAAPPEPIICTTCKEGLTVSEVMLLKTIGLKKPYCTNCRNEGMIQQMKENAGTDVKPSGDE